jgi:hypothetical protein
MAVIQLSHLFEQSCSAGALREKLVKYRHYLELKAAERSVGEGGIGRGGVTEVVFMSEADVFRSDNSKTMECE